MAHVSFTNISCERLNSLNQNKKRSLAAPPARGPHQLLHHLTRGSRLWRKGRRRPLRWKSHLQVEVALVVRIPAKRAWGAGNTWNNASLGLSFNIFNIPEPQTLCLKRWILESSVQPKGPERHQSQVNGEKGRRVSEVVREANTNVEVWELGVACVDSPTKIGPHSSHSRGQHQLLVETKIHCTIWGFRFPNTLERTLTWATLRYSVHKLNMNSLGKRACCTCHVGT